VVGSGKEGGKGLNGRIKVLGKAGLNTLEDEVKRGIVAREAKGTVAMVTTNLVQVPKDILKSTMVRL
jgi:hypothetical protein